MSNLNIQDLKPELAVKRDFSNSQISLKRDGTLIYFKEGKLFSPRCERSERFAHILNILKQKDMPELYGEMYIEGGNVFDVSSSENWKSCCFMPIDLEDKKLNYSERQVLLNQLVKEISNPFITPLVKFKDFKSGWDYVKKTNGEGLVIRNEREWIKVKALQNTKIEIVSHETGKDKGCFILSNGNRVSGTSKELVRQFNEIKKRGNKAIAEISYPFITPTGHYFQPRLTNLCEVTNEKMYSL